MPDGQKQVLHGKDGSIWLVFWPSSGIVVQLKGPTKK
jgi:hypothetical protein